ncbi:helix-turn-helix domain-containing protein [Escherichia coli]|uniref:helix-turn-helix domain-containing protein n=1 Tax=Escherichia coli TaxID=562 RepID=UPI000FBBC636|nr:helix-turn-helix transcriptional regulator [Escherichia coli]EEC9551157.1 helix-turn-helix domain-containing protein [Escherichia coli]EEQ3787645.1 helix-turn-helix domain-containing protein [Escherichia coli]EER2662255.1 helix-turn-helix domain-containing protein [Escherichia coli]EER8214968.1 helix-turn-helix domain-containing protein [Escherichia coli]EER8389574.1 helix-turn-helix domain-containing protein [Escherichia coli]
MRNVSIDYSQRLMRMREAEELSRRQFSDITGIPLNTIQKYETGHQPARAELVERVLQVDRFKKYALWLMTGQVSPDNGQIEPTPLAGSGSEVVSELGEKLRLIREAEGLSRRAMEEVTGVSQNNLKNYEILGRMIPGETLLLILNHPRFRKYSDWVMFNQTNAATGQIAPPLSLDGFFDSEGDQVSTETSQKSPR